MSRKINIRPTSGVYATYKRLSYQPWTAIAEFVDNSTQSFYDHHDKLFQTKYYKGLVIEIKYQEDAQNGDSITIIDNAYGMEWQDFQRAVVLDRPPKITTGRNEFGMGLKTAACWFGSLWSVESTQLGSRNKFYTEINTEELGKYKTEEISVDEEIVSPRDHYTKVTIKNLNKKIKGPRTIGKVKELLSSIYRQDLRTGEIKIYYNGTALQFKEVPIYTEQIENKVETWKKDISLKINHEGRELFVKGFIAIRMPGSVKDAGFTLLRRGRVIVGGSERNYRPSELFGDSNSYAYQRLFGELHMDNWPVTQAKDSFDWHNSGLEETFITALSPFVQDFRKKAENIRVREAARPKDIIRDGVKDFERSKIVENVDIKTHDHEHERDCDHDRDHDHKNNHDTETNESHSEQRSSENHKDGSNSTVFNDHTEILFKYKGQDFIFHIKLELDNPSLQWLLVDKLGTNEYSLIINMSHPFFKPLIDKRDLLPTLFRFAIALTLAEVETAFLSNDGRINACDIRIKMNEILDRMQKGELKNGK